MRHAEQFQLIPEEDMPFNLTRETIPEEEPPQKTTTAEHQADLIP